MDQCKCIDTDKVREVVSHGDDTQVKCNACSEDKILKPGENVCVCRKGESKNKPGFYLADAGNGTCLTCPPGADCSSSHGATLPELSALPGYWRPSAFSGVFLSCAEALSRAGVAQASELAEERCCPVTQSAPEAGAENDSNSSQLSQCKGLDLSGVNTITSGAQCAEGYGGALCMSCADSTWTMNGVAVAECVKCTDGASMGALLGVLSAVFAVLSLVFAVVFFKAGSPTGEIKDSEASARSAKSATEGQTRSERTRNFNAVQHFAQEQVQIGRLGAGSGRSAFRSDGQVIFDRIKVLYSWIQIFASLTLTFTIAWPRMFSSMSMNFGIFMLDLGNVLGSTCSLAVPYLDNFRVHMVLPLVFLLTICLSGLPIHFIRKTPEQRRGQLAIRMKLITSVALMLYPGICTKLFSILKCISLPALKTAEGEHSGLVMAASYEVECWTGPHQEATIIAIIAIFVWVLGIPAGIFCMLFRHRHVLYIHDGATDKEIAEHEDAVAEYGTVYLQYEPQYYWVGLSYYVCGPATPCSGCTN